MRNILEIYFERRESETMDMFRYYKCIINKCLKNYK